VARGEAPTQLGVLALDDTVATARAIAAQGLVQGCHLVPDPVGLSAHLDGVVGTGH
jgi:hypothetical protein